MRRRRVRATALRAAAFATLAVVSSFCAPRTAFGVARHAALRQLHPRGRAPPALTIRPCLQQMATTMSPEQMLAIYSALLVSDPVPTKIATATILGGAGDLVAQGAEAASKGGSCTLQLDPKRSLSMMLFSALYTGSFQSWWINALEANVHLANSVADAAVKTGLCQFGTIPLVYMPTFFLVTGAVRGMDFQALADNVKQNYVRIYSRNVLFWIPVQMFQFLCVSREWQIPFLCAAGFTWAVILSYIALNQQAPPVDRPNEVTDIAEAEIGPAAQQDLEIQQQNLEIQEHDIRGLPARLVGGAESRPVREPAGQVRRVRGAQRRKPATILARVGRPPGQRKADHQS